MKTKDFIGKFNEAEVIQRMTSVKTPEEAYAVAQEYGVTDSMEEFVEEMTKFKAAIDELSEEDLEAVAGGLSPEAIISLASATAASAVSATATAVSATATAVSASVAIASAAASALVSASAGTAATLVSAATGASVGVSILGASAAAAV
ncbi:MAG: hypothetical protein PHE79_10750 [Eubacteriales bacterium]|nr:hypothetical protein [Eubacteriales bacterium]